MNDFEFVVMGLMASTLFTFPLAWCLSKRYYMNTREYESPHEPFLYL